MLVTILAVGSMGDVIPCERLAEGLMQRGHRTRILADKRYENEIRQKGIDFVSLPGDMDEFLSIIGNPKVGALKMIKLLKKYYKEYIDPTEEALLKGFEGSDVILFASPSSAMAVYIAEALKLPYARIGFFPDLDCSDFTQFVFPKLPFPGPLRKIYNRLSFNISYSVTMSIYKKAFASWRKKYKLPHKKYFWERSDGKKMEHLMVYSEAVVPRPREYGDNIYICGYLFDKNNKPEFTPDPTLAEFLAAEPKPLYIGFGSMIEGSFDALQDMVIKALERTGQRAVIYKGWGRSYNKENLPENVYMVEGYCPHDWLFEKVSGVVHHGGAGTTAAGLRAGKPTFIIPFGSEQKFWGERVNLLGCGPKPIERKKLNVKKLADSLKALDSPETRRNAEHIAALLAMEDGVEAACDAVERIAAEGFGK